MRFSSLLLLLHVIGLTSFNCNSIAKETSMKKQTSQEVLYFSTETITDGTVQATLHEKIVCDLTEIAEDLLEVLIDTMIEACKQAIMQNKMVTAAWYTMQINDLGFVSVYIAESSSGDSCTPPLIFWNASESSTKTLPENLKKKINMIQKEYLRG